MGAHGGGFHGCNQAVRPGRLGPKEAQVPGCLCLACAGPQEAAAAFICLVPHQEDSQADLLQGEGPYLSRPLGPGGGGQDSPMLRRAMIWAGVSREGLATPSPLSAPLHHPLQPVHIPVKLNVAAILRGGALYQRQVEKELKR